MPRRRLALIAAVVLTPLVAFGLTRVILDGGDDASSVAADRSTTSTSEAPATTTSTTSTSTTTTAPPPRLGPSSPLPSVPQPGEPTADSTPDGRAAQLRDAWAALGAMPADVDRQAHVYQVVVRSLTASDDKGESVIRLLDGDLATQVRADVDAGVKLRSLVGKPRTALPPWRIVQPPPADELLTHYRAAQTETGVPWYYLAAINLVESRMGRIRGTSEAGAQGPMQFLPATWAQYGEGGDINSYKDAIAAAARYLKRNGAPGDMRNAVWNYNHDYRYVDAVLAYGDRMNADPRAYLGYYHWQVYYVTTAGDIWLPVGYGT